MFKKVTPAAVPAATRENAVSILQQLPPHYPVLSATELLRGKQFPQILSQIQTLAFTPDHVFDSLYLKSLHNYTEFVQGLPATHVDNFNYHGGLLELGIRRALQTLAWYRREYPIRQHTPENLPTRQAIWSYALFTAGLLYGVGQVVATYWVMLCHMNGHPDKLWNPVAGNMAHHGGEFYRYSFETARRDELAARSTLALALQILPAEGISWIATDKEIFNSWLSILLKDETHAGLFAQCVFPADADLANNPNEEAGLIIGEFIEQFDIEGTGHPTDKHKDASFFDHENEEPASQAAHQQAFAQTGMFVPGKAITAADVGIGISGAEIGVAFLLWLRNGIRGQGVNMARDLVVAPEGTLISRALVDSFAAENSRFGDGESAYNQLKNSAFALGHAMPQAISSLIGLAQNDKRGGILLDTAAIFGKKIPGSGISYEQRLVVTNKANYPPVLNQAAAAIGMGKK